MQDEFLETRILDPPFARQGCVVNINISKKIGNVKCTIKEKLVNDLI